MSIFYRHAIRHARQARIFRPGSHLAQAGKYFEAWQKLTEDNPLAAVHGRVCYHPCESSCNRGSIDTSVSIHSVERFLGDMAIAKGWTFAPPKHQTGKKRTCDRCRPERPFGGLSSRQAGARCDDLRSGADGRRDDEFRYSCLSPAAKCASGRDQKDRRPWRQLSYLIKKVDDVMAEKTAGNFDAVFIAIGAHIGKKTDIPARDASKILDAVTFLKDVELGKPTKHRAACCHLRRRQYSDGRREDRQTPRSRRGSDHLPTRPRAHAGPRF